MKNFMRKLLNYLDVGINREVRNVWRDAYCISSDTEDVQLAVRDANMAADAFLRYVNTKLS